ncbi:MAG: carboxypeptidase regulatory-like domain-containing protein [Terracidiphilus sp.]
MRSRINFLLRNILPLLVLLSAALQLPAQSTESALLGAVKDASGAVIVHASVVVKNIDQGINSSYRTDADGVFQALALAPGNYQLTVSKPGFETKRVEGIVLAARQQVRVDVTLPVASANAEVTVRADYAGAIETEGASVASSLNAQDVSNLPVNYYGTGGTSPLNALQTVPGVQSDTASGTVSPSANGTATFSFSVQGGQPFQTETAVDGISTQNVRYNSPLSDAFPSAESIAEIRVDGVSNDAEFGQAGEITTVTKSGTNQYHGSLFWHFQNRDLDATAFGEATKPQKVGNDFGVSIGGPATLPHVYRGQDRTFFFATYEGFRFPKQSTIQDLVPTTAMLGGDFSAETPELINPANATPYSGSKISSINASAKPFLSFFPKPNYPAASPYATIAAATASGAAGYNYTANLSSDYNSNQFDVRLDHRLSKKLQLFARYTQKDVSLLSPQDLNVPSVTNFDNYRILAGSAVYAVNDRLLNEFRFGMTWERNGQRNALNGAPYTDEAAFDDVGGTYAANGMTAVVFPTDLTSLYAGNINQTTASHLFQYDDILTWSKGRHTMKFGADIRPMLSVSTLGTANLNNVEGFAFAGLYTSGFETIPEAVGIPLTIFQFADFLAGAPYETEYYTLVPQNQGQSVYSAAFAQDQWKISNRLTLSLGLRYEYHPALHDTHGEIGNFDPSVSTTGEAIYPAGYSSALSAPYLTDFDACGYGPAATSYAACTPVVSSSQAGLPSSLRKTQKDRFLPRVGLAWLPFGGDRTAIRAGFGMYNTTLLGSNFFSLTDTLQAATLVYYNTFPPYYPPTYTWPQTTPSTSSSSITYGTASFETANQIDWKDPYSLQWDLSVDHAWSGGIGTRISYIGMRTDDLVWGSNMNDMSYSSTTKAASRPLTDRPFPNWGTINDRLTGAIANYNSMQAEADRRFQNGFTFQSAYTWAKNLSDNLGARSTGFGRENGSNVGGVSTYRLNPMLDYGNVYGTRRHRWTTSAVYAVPFGRGQRYGANIPHLADSVAGGWQLSSIFLLQTGPYLTAYIPSASADPSGTGSGVLFGRDQRPDVNGNWKPASQTRNQWVNPAALVCPSNSGYTSSSYAGNSCGVGVTSTPIGRFGNERVGTIVGPGTVNLSLGLNKRFSLGDRFSLRAEGTFTNVLNHANLNDPALDITNSNFGKITTSRGSDFGGSRTGQIAIKLEY